jgi:NTP pyrophosphatase (non-canonical NTP hydrolase)
MNDTDTPLATLRDRVAAFCAERDWDRFHGPRDLAIGIVTEAAELLALFRFRSEAEAAALLTEPGGRQRVAEELADVLFFVLRLAERHGIDLTTAFLGKLAANAERYPVEKARGSNRKYDEL